MKERLLEREEALNLRMENITGLGEPEELFERLALLPYSAFLDSSLRMNPFGAHSFLAFDPYLVISFRKGVCTYLERGGKTTALKEHPLQALRRALQSRKLVDAPPQLPPFLCGGVGYIAYELGRYIERLPTTTIDDLALPEMAFAFYDKVVAFDHLASKSYLVVSSPDNPANARERAYRMLLTPSPSYKWPSPEQRPLFTSNFTREGYLEAVRKVKEYILAGDIYQANLSQRFTTTLRMHPWRMYRRLRSANAAPFSAYLNFGEAQICSSSPERFLKVEGTRVETRPIKGTRRRSSDPEEDLRLKEELRSSDKDRAELAMIVDLERNDLGRVCSYGSVQVKEHAVIESYATVHHLVSTVVGDLHKGTDVIDLLRATFPGGSITGAPKIRSMEIIDELEPTSRSVYTGSLGYLGFNGMCDLNIAIRTIIVKGGRAYFQVGGGIVADSSPEDEYEETLHKGKALFEALTSD
jgi:para-aminobenzoate synthetase component 1